MLWNDIIDFLQQKQEEYFLGNIVTFNNIYNGQTFQEIIDGQQRITSLLLLIRALYEKIKDDNSEDAQNLKRPVEQCLWMKKGVGGVDKTSLKLISKVVSDENIDKLKNILNNGVSSNDKSLYAKNYAFFCNKIKEHFNTQVSAIPAFIDGLLDKCFVFHIVADEQETAFTIFTTLNDRGMPLQDSDIFKSQFYKYYKNLEKVDYFTANWKQLEEKCNRIFDLPRTFPINELFTRYHYWLRTKTNNSDTTLVNLRKFYKQYDGKTKKGNNSGNYEILQNDDTFCDLLSLLTFWDGIEIYGKEVQKQFFVLFNAPNGIWTYFVSVYFMAHKNEMIQKSKNSNSRIINFELIKEPINYADFVAFLKKTIAFIWAYSFITPGLSALRPPIFNAMLEVSAGKMPTFTVSGKPVKFKESEIKEKLQEYEFTNGKALTRAMLAWWASYNNNQTPLALERKTYEIEHIVAKDWVHKNNLPMDDAKLEMIGNKSLLESPINKRATNYAPDIKWNIYLAEKNNKGKNDKRTEVQELLDIAINKIDYSKNGKISERTNKIIVGFIDFLKECDLLLDF